MATVTPVATPSRSPMPTPTNQFTVSNVHADTDGVLASLAPLTEDLIATSEVFDQTQEFNASIAFTPVGAALTGAAIGGIVTGVVGAALVAAAAIAYFIFRKRPALSEDGAPETTANRDAEAGDDEADLRGGSVAL